MKGNVFITGASQGLGKYCAIEFAKRGYNLFLTARNIEALRSVQSEIKSISNVACEIAYLDVTNLKDWQKAYDLFFSHFSKIDVILLNAGVSNPFWFEQFDLDNIRQTFEINLFGVVNGLNQFLPKFLSQKFGKIAVVSSLADSRGFVGSSPYCASKIALSYLAEAAAIELSSSKIQVINIRPGFVRTNMTAKNKFPMPFLMDPDKAAKIMVNGIEKGKKVVSFPFATNFLTKLIKITPNFIYSSIIKKIRIN